MIISSQLRPGRIYSFAYNGNVDMVGKREFDGVTQENPLASADVTVRRMVTGQAAGEHTYENAMRKIEGENWQKSDRKDWAHTDPENDCILVHNKTEERYLRLLPRGVQSETYFINGNIATSAEVDTIRKFKKSANKAAPVYVRFNLDNIENLHDDGEA